MTELEETSITVDGGDGDWSKCNGYTWNNRCFPTRKARREAKRWYRKNKK